MSNSTNEKTPEQSVNDLGLKVFSAIRNKDIDVLDDILAEDFVHRSETGAEVAKKEFMQGISDMAVDITSVYGTHLNVRIFGQVAVMTGVQHANWRQPDEEEGLSSTAFVDVFELRETQWKMVLAYGVELTD